MAFIMGVYQELIDAIKSFDVALAKKALRFDVRGALDHVPWRFLLALGSGILISILSLAHLVTYLLVAISAMILPGISGSFILLILGQCAYVLTAVKGLDVLTLLPFAAGCVLGLMGFSRVLSWLFAYRQRLTVALLVGFMLGSLRKIWPFKEVIETRIDRHGEEVPTLEHNLLPDPAAPETWWALGLAVAGFVAILALDRLRRRL